MQYSLIILNNIQSHQNIYTKISIYVDNWLYTIINEQLPQLIFVSVRFCQQITVLNWYRIPCYLLYIRQKQIANDVKRKTNKFY